MSRTNHYRLCDECTAEQFCWLHERPYSSYEHKPQREILGRRNWTRHSRWPDFSPGVHHNPPPRWWWHEQHARARSIYRQMLRREEDPALPPEKYLIDLWGWY